jgi:dihydroflavonol-4-reductase
MSEVLITGATGYIGGKLAEFYASSGKRIRLFVRNPEKLPAFLRESCEISVGDITRPEALAAACENVAAAIHAAGLLGKWGTPYEEMRRVNVEGVEALLTAAQAAGVRRIVHLSAGGVTGPLGSQPADETYPPAPVTDYERSKWEGERRALECARRLRLSLIVVRPTFTYGPGDPHKLNLFRAIQKGMMVFIGDGASTTHPVYIDDLVVGIDAALNSRVENTVVILGGEHPVTKRELIWGIADALGVKRPKIRIPVTLGNILAGCCETAAKVLYFDPPITRSRVLMMSRNWGYSIQRARELLNYRPQVSLQEGLRRTIAWYREHGWL